MSRCSHIARPSCHAHVDAGAAERDALGVEPRALAGAPCERSVRAHDAVPPQGGGVGRSGSSQAWSTEPAKRGAPGETSPYDATNPGGMARTRPSTTSVRDRTDAI